MLFQPKSAAGARPEPGFTFRVCQWKKLLLKCLFLFFFFFSLHHHFQGLNFCPYQDGVFSPYKKLRNFLITQSKLFPAWLWKGAAQGKKKKKKSFLRLKEFLRCHSQEWQKNRHKYGSGNYLGPERTWSSKIRGKGGNGREMGMFWGGSCN